MQYMKVHHGEVHHKEVHHEEVQLKLQRHKSDRWEKTTVGILRHCTSCILAAQEGLAYIYRGTAQDLEDATLGGAAQGGAAQGGATQVVVTQKTPSPA